MAMFDDMLIKPDWEIRPISVSLFIGSRHLASAQNSPGRQRAPAVLAVLLEAGLDLNKTTCEYCWTSLSYMMLSTKGSSISRANMAKLLLDARANPDLADDMNWTSLHLAIERGDADMVKLLIEKGASLTVMTGKGIRHCV
ncbi:hypothetical protein ACJ73_06576 [Blastomyces percursus]|uniref:Uncharacterized protein n=1 Tax=Blastomyces percursus TaxID=1658174 RepID=A0A1J9QPG9_9EURO|nr:hypothetical protein ACJ73_06576 [Blastomyces percursus]